MCHHVYVLCDFQKISEYEDIVKNVKKDEVIIVDEVEPIENLENVEPAGNLGNVEPTPRVRCSQEFTLSLKQEVADSDLDPEDDFSDIVSQNRAKIVFTWSSIDKKIFNLFLLYFIALASAKGSTKKEEI